MWRYFWRIYGFDDKKDGGGDNESDDGDDDDDDDGAHDDGDHDHDDDDHDDDDDWNDDVTGRWVRYPALDIKMQSLGDALESGHQMSRCCDSIFQDSVFQDCIHTFLHQWRV